MRHVNALALTGVVCFVLGVLSVEAGADRPPGQSTPTFRGRTDLIPVDVSVLDRNRKPVRGLTAADFEVFEDGRPRPIVAFLEVEVPAAVAEPTAPTAAWVRDAPRDVVSNDLAEEGRLVAILMDRSIQAGAPTILARRIATAAVNELGPGDLAAVTRSSGFGNDGRSQGFTTDRRLLLDAVESSFMGMTVLAFDAGGVVTASPVPGQDRGFEPADCYCGLCVFETIENIATAMRDAPRRRKVLLFVGSSIVIQEPPSNSECYGVVRLPRRRMMRELEMSNVTVHTIDPAGLITTAPTAEQITTHGISPQLVFGRNTANLQRVDNLRVLPDHTGGRTVVNTNDPDEHLPDIFAESQSYYLLGFEPTTVATDGEVHEIEVKVNRRGTNVRTRSGYAVYPPKADAVNAEFADLADVVATLDRPLPSADIPLTTAVAAFAVPGSREAAVAVVVGADLPMRAAPRRVSLVAAAFDRRGRSAGVQRQTIELPLSPSAYVDEGLIARLNLAPGRYDVRVAVKDEASGAIGSVFTFVDVPAFAEAAVSISGLLIREPDAPAMPDNPMADLFAFVPTVRRAFGPNEQASVFARVYQHAGVPAPVTVTTRVVDVRDQQVFAASQELPASAFGATGADYAIELPLSTLTPGDYLLTVTAGDAAHGARGEVRFTALLAEDTRSLNSGCSNTGSPDTRSPDSGCP